MAYITQYNLKKIIFNSDIKDLMIDGEIYKFPFYNFSKYEKNQLLAIKELMKSPDSYFTEIYKPYKTIDTYSYVYEGKQPAFHKTSVCPRLKSNFTNFEIPTEIKDKGQETVIEFRVWFETVKHLLENKPDVFVERLRLRWAIVTNPKALDYDNSGCISIENLTQEEIEAKIDSLIKEAGRFFYKDDKNKIILRRFGKLTFLAYKTEEIYNNDTGYSDKEVRELLKYYNEEFKKPLKKYLIEYYRHKYNPEIIIEGYHLDHLGFKSCSHCFDKTRY